MLTSNIPTPGATTAVEPTRAIAPTTKSAPRTYEDCDALIREALAQPQKAEETLQQLQKFFVERIAKVKTTRERDGFDGVKQVMENKYKTRTPAGAGLIGQA